VERILAAKTLYEVLGVDPKALDFSALRKAYLSTSVKVHPDKNPHPDATAAFQRVAEAWNTLSDDSARAAYDAELRSTAFSPSAARATGTPAGPQYYAYDFERTHMPSFPEALFMFAAATSMFMGGTSAAGSSSGAGGGAGAFKNVASDFVDTLFWAQKLSEGRQEETEYMDPNDPNFNGQNARSGTAAEAASNNPMASGMALGSGLRAVAATQRMMGFKKGAAATEKAASTVQMAAVGASVLKAASDVPAVQRTLERGKNSLQNNPQIGQGLRASLKFAGHLVQSLLEAQDEAQQQQQGNGNGNRKTGNAYPSR
jgi:curved DNA-binding protein CbpA